ncbi:hypothetical protein NDU88_005978 [Pleurodeles waltl]|uniref:Macro domain-containing protein n=1 Tax=Pleurodeles waltl TaxID=8319 RepID=A0AAV7N236_PLEWA|nr:hypothetical protein NDU88_005978 [Pleurodeles waltl]
MVVKLLWRLPNNWQERAAIRRRQNGEDGGAVRRDVIHTVGPVAQGDPSPTQEGELSNCYKNSLKLLLENKLRTVAFPCISTGVYGYPNAAAADVALNTIRLWLEENKDKVDRIIICVFLEKDEEIYLKKMAEYFPTGSAIIPQSNL